MPDEMDTLLAAQRARLAAGERELLIKRARGAPSAGVCFTLIAGLFLMTLATVLGLLDRKFAGSGLFLIGLINALVGYQRMTNERIEAIIALLDEEKHGPKEAWIRRIRHARDNRG